jgi:YbbR domain-containing protein
MRNPFRNNLGGHLLAFALSVVLWFFVKSTLSPVRPAELGTRRLTAVPIEFRNRPTELEFVRLPSGTATLTVRGPHEVLDALTTGDVVAFIDLRGLTEGVHQMSIRVDVPAGVEVTGASPVRMEVLLERIISTQVPVSLSLNGSVAPGFYAPPGFVEPEAVVVTGGRSAVAKVAPFVIVLDVSGAERSLVATIALPPLTHEGEPIAGVAVNPEQVVYRQPVWPTRSVPVRVSAPDLPEQGGISFTPSPDTVVIAGDMEELRDIDELVVLLGAGEWEAGETVEVDLILPQGVYLISPESPRISIMVISETEN